MTEESKSIIYHFTVADGTTYSHTVQLSTDQVIDHSSGDYPEWTSLAFQRCKNCEWDKSDYCPVAINLREAALLLGKFRSYDMVDVVVETPERTYNKHTSIQEGLSGLLGLIMARSGCPAFEAFRGPGWFHLPFSTMEETMFRITGSYMLRQFLLGDGTAESREQIVQNVQSTYETVAIINRCIMQRLKAGVKVAFDAPYNAITILDSMGGMVSMSIPDGMDDLRKYFR